MMKPLPTKICVVLATIGAVGASASAQADYIGTIGTVAANPTHFERTHEDNFQVSVYLTQSSAPGRDTCAARVLINGVKVDQLIVVDPAVPFDPARTDIKQRHWGWVYVVKNPYNPSGGLPIPFMPGSYTVRIEGEDNATGNPTLGNGHYLGTTLHGCYGSASFTVTVTDGPVM